MARTAASLLREALEHAGVRYTFGIPGVHNTEIYDELARSETITPVLVTHEGGGAFMADAAPGEGDGVLEADWPWLHPRASAAQQMVRSVLMLRFPSRPGIAG